MARFRPESWALGKRPGMNVLVAEPQGAAPIELEALERIDLTGPEGRETRPSLPREAAVADPMAPEPERRIEELTIDRLRLRWDGEHFPMAMARDRSTSPIITFARGGGAMVSATGLGAGDLEVLLSDGVRSTRASPS